MGIAVGLGLIVAAAVIMVVVYAVAYRDTYR